jgi:hypothetical protein
VPDPVPDPTLGSATPDALCSLGLRPRLLTGAFVQQARAHFSDPNGIADPALRHLHWSSNPATASIVIESITKWRPEVSGQRPAIVVRRDAYTPQKIAINNFACYVQQHDGAVYYTSVAKGTHTFFCIAGEPGEAELLGDEWYDSLLAFGPEWRVALQLLRFQVVEHGALHKIEEAAGSYAVPITVECGYNETRKVLQYAPKLKRISLQTFLDSCR